uniref:cation:proton antiporter n=1 Tax=Aetokthonos hydrillicola TaxID=1550245 RepID=UPI001ABB7464
MELISQFLALEPTSQVLGKEPIVPFAILLLVILIVPILFERLRLPGIFGLLASGIVLGPHGWNLLQTASPLMTLLSDIGLVYLIFVAGLEVDLVQFRRNKNRSLAFGSFTFLVPLFVGATVVRIFGFNWNAAILVGSLFASYTLLAYPILTRLAVVSNEAVNMTIGASILTDASVLLILTVCVAIHTNKLGVWQVVTLLNSLIIYALFILIGFDWLGKQFFRRSGDDQGNQFLFVLLSVFLASVGAQFIGVQKIVGAFLAGLAVNEVLGDGPVKEKILFVGNVLFIPIFFVNVGLLVNLPIFLKSFGTLNLTLLILIGLVTSKFIAAFLTKLFYRYNWQETLTIWSLSIPQAGVTLAATLVPSRAGILNLYVLDSALF